MTIKTEHLDIVLSNLCLRSLCLLMILSKQSNELYFLSYARHSLFKIMSQAEDAYKVIMKKQSQLSEIFITDIFFNICLMVE